LVQRRRHLADEQVVAVTREGVVGEQQQTVVAVTGPDPTLVASEEVRGVVGHDRAALVGSVRQQHAVIDATQVGLIAILDRYYVVAAVA
jgi:hypothetical protein